jgi:hypothetical protein
VRPLRPLDVLDQYHENKIDRATAINHFQLFIENSDIEVLRLDALDFLGEMTPLHKEIFILLENLLVSDSIPEMRAIAAKLILTNFLKRGKTTIEYVCKNPCPFIVIKYILDASKEVDLKFYNKLRTLFINKYARKYEVFPNEAEFFLDLDFELFKQHGKDFEQYPNVKDYSCEYVFQLRNLKNSGSEKFYSTHNFHVTGLNLNGWWIESLPDSIAHLKRLRYLDLGHNPLTKLPESIKSLSKLREFILEWTNLCSIPKWIYTLGRKRYAQKFIREGVNSSDAPILGIFQILIGNWMFFKYTNLEEETDGWAQGYTIDESGYVTGIHLVSDFVSISSLPDEIINLTHLQELNICGLKIENLSVLIKKFLANLKGFESFEEQGIGFGLKDLRKFKNLGN